MNGYKYKNIPISHSGSTARDYLNGIFQIKKFKDDFNIRITVDDDNYLRNLRISSQNFVQKSKIVLL